MNRNPLGRPHREEQSEYRGKTCAEVQWTKNVTQLQGYTHNLVLMVHVTQQDFWVLSCNSLFLRIIILLHCMTSVFKICSQVCFLLSSFLTFPCIDLDTGYLTQGWCSLYNQNRKHLAQNTPLDYNILDTDLVEQVQLFKGSPLAYLPWQSYGPIIRIIVVAR